MGLPPQEATLAQIGEDGLIAAIADLVPNPTGTVTPDHFAVGIGDDAAVLPPGPAGGRLVTTVDAFVEGTHFILPPAVAPWLVAQAPLLARGLSFGRERALRSLGAGREHLQNSDRPQDWTEVWCQALGHRLAMANLSDLAAMGAQPAALTLVVAAPDAARARHLVRIAQGVAEAGAAAGAPLIGGDTVRTTGPLVLTLTALGWLDAGTAPALRRHARPGDRLFVTGCVGSGALAPGLFVGTDTPANTARATRDALRLVIKHLTKPARIREGRLHTQRDQTRTAANPASGPCLTDVSDGLLREAWRIARAARVHVELQGETLPGHPAARRHLAQSSEQDQAARLLASGEEWELLIATETPPQGFPNQEIGTIQAPHPTGLVTLTWKGQPWTPTDHTFRHFQ